MTPSILLLDCEADFEETLRKQGFDVLSGTTGFISGARRLPCQVYERNIIIFDPKPPKNKLLLTDYIVRSNNLTPEYNLNNILEHLNRGAVILAFLKDLPVSDSIKFPYSWIPAMPEIAPTKDSVINSVDLEGNWIQPVVGKNYLKNPVLIKLLTTPSVGRRLYLNGNQEALGYMYDFGYGRVILLPDGKDNEKVINVFLHRALPKFWDYESQQALIDEFISPEEESLQKQLSDIVSEQEKLEEKQVEIKEKIVTANLNKTNTIKEDDTAVLILNYFDLALQQPDVSLFYLYKVTEALEKKFGNEKTAKETLRNNKEWNLIGTLANASYADVRHAPDPGEKKKEWTEEEITNCFEAAKKIIASYLLSLF